MPTAIDAARHQDPWYKNPAEQIRVHTWTQTPPGQKVQYEHPVVGNDPLTEQRGLPVLVAAGAKEGPVLLLIAGEHGNEYEPILALQDTINSLDPTALKGTVVGVSCCSVDSYLHRSRTALTDGQNLARCYPGNPSGSLTERVAYTLQNDFLGQSGSHKPTFLVALHTFGPNLLGATMSGYNIYPNVPHLTEAQHRASLATGLPLVWGHEFDPGHAAAAPMGDDANGRTAMYAAFLADTPALYWETVWGQGGEAEYKGALKRLMIHLGILAGENSPLEPRATIESTGHGAGNMASHNQSPLAGLWTPAVQVWDQVVADDLLGTIRDLYGKVQQEIRAQRNGLVIAVPKPQYVEAGTQCGIIV